MEHSNRWSAECRFGGDGLDGEMLPIRLASKLDDSDAAAAVGVDACPADAALGLLEAGLMFAVEGVTAAEGVMRIFTTVASVALSSSSSDTRRRFR